MGSWTWLPLVPGSLAYLTKLPSNAASRPEGPFTNRKLHLPGSRLMQNLLSACAGLRALSPLELFAPFRPAPSPSQPLRHPLATPMALAKN